MTLHPTPLPVPTKVPVGVLLSGSGTNLQALLTACAGPYCPAAIRVVISNRAKAYGLERARQAGIPAIHLSPKAFDNRHAYDAQLVQVLQQHGVRWVAMAGFMRLVTSVLLNAFPQRVLNVHPALLPAFPGLHGVRQALAYGVRIAGVTVHLVDAGTDTGPIIAQGATPVLPGETEAQLAARLHALEHQLYPKVLCWACEDRLTVTGRTVQVRLPPGERTWLWHDAPG